jgi:hypothetical protein
MDTFDGTLYEKKKPRPPAVPEVRPVAPVAEVSKSVAAPVPPDVTPAAVAEMASTPPRRTWVYLLVGILIGVVLLMLLAFGGALAYYLLT